MVHRHSLTFRHSQGEARITSHETRNEQANRPLACAPGRLSPHRGVHSQTLGPTETGLQLLWGLEEFQAHRVL